MHGACPAARIGSIAGHLSRIWEPPILAGAQVILRKAAATHTYIPPQALHEPGSSVCGALSGG